MHCPIWRRKGKTRLKNQKNILRLRFTKLPNNLNFSLLALQNVVHLFVISRQKYAQRRTSSCSSIQDTWCPEEPGKRPQSQNTADMQQVQYICDMLALLHTLCDWSALLHTGNTSSTHFYRDISHMHHGYCKTQIHVLSQLESSYCQN